jgi:predicted transcriptional regulator
MEGRGDKWSTAAEDDATEAAVLQQVLTLHPTQVTEAELARELTPKEAGFRERDAIDRAVRDLVAAGLLHRREEFVLPTRAALRFSQLLDR